MSNSLDHNSTNFQNGSKGVEVFVGGLARTLTEDKVHKVFSACGEILEMRLIKDQRGGLKGFGFIRFATKEAADKALKELEGSMLEGKKIGILPSVAQDTLFLGNLNKRWSADDFNKVIRQVFPDVVSIDLSQPLSGSDTAPNKKFKNRGFGFVSSHLMLLQHSKVSILLYPTHQHCYYNVLIPNLRRGINMAVDSVVTHLKRKSRMISTSEEITQHLMNRPSLLFAVTPPLLPSATNRPAPTKQVNIIAFTLLVQNDAMEELVDSKRSFHSVGTK